MGFVFAFVRSTLLRLIAPLIFLGLGWYGGARYGAPDAFVGAIDGMVKTARAVASNLSPEDSTNGSEQAGDASLAAAENGASEPSAPITGRESAAVGDDIILCDTTVSNPPRRGAPGERIGSAAETITYQGANLLLMPTTDSCLSSGFGYRGFNLHKGVDYFSDQGGDVLAAGDGVIVEAVTRSDFGNMVVIDHGGGVYTRYAHLARFNAGVRESASVIQGQVLGPIGNSGASNVVHLHYEVLTGDFNTAAKSFGLKAVDPFSL